MRQLLSSLIALRFFSIFIGLNKIYSSFSSAAQTVSFVCLLEQVSVNFDFDISKFLWKNSKQWVAQHQICILHQHVACQLQLLLLFVSSLLLALREAATNCCIHAIELSALHLRMQTSLLSPNVALNEPWHEENKIQDETRD